MSATVSPVDGSTPVVCAPRVAPSSLPREPGKPRPPHAYSVSEASNVISVTDRHVAVCTVMLHPSGSLPNKFVVMAARTAESRGAGTGLGQLWDRRTHQWGRRGGGRGPAPQRCGAPLPSSAVSSSCRGRVGDPGRLAPTALGRVRVTERSVSSSRRQ